MPTYAILGGTGNTGSELIKLLAQQSSAILHVYARSQDKLLKTHPILSDPTSSHKIFTGDLSNVDLFAQCLAGTDAVFGVVGTNANNPKLHLAEELANVIIAALSKLKSTSTSTSLRNGNSNGDETYVPPTVVFLTSAGMTSDPHVRANFPAYLHWMLQRVGKYIYADFLRTTALFRQAENAWIPVIFLCAPGIMPGKSQGKIEIGNRISAKAPLYVTYADLARGMVQAAGEERKWVHREIGIVGAKMPPLEYGLMMWVFSTNLMCVWAPPVWRFGNRRGWWGDK